MHRTTPRASTFTRRAFAGLAAGTLVSALGRQTFAASPTPIATVDADVRIEAGVLRGIQFEQYAAFRGVPYAAPPTGDLRWVAPQPVEPWGSEPRLAREFGSIAMQIPVLSGLDPSSSEDCLFLNVYVPGQPRPGRDMPVIVWVHGGANMVGAGSDYDPQRWAIEQDVIVVTMNYRLGIFGTFAFEGLEDGGTFGMLDLVAALEWIQTNIAAFGGDPGNATVAGQSWGGLMVSSLLASPRADGLLHRAIVQSGVLFADLASAGVEPPVSGSSSFWITEDEKSEALRRVLDELRIENTRFALPLLRQLPGEVLLPFSLVSVPYVWGGSFMPEEPRAVTMAGRALPVPVISGCNRDEARSYSTMLSNELPDAITDETYPLLLEQTFGDDADAVASHYDVAAYDTPANAWAAIVTDREWSRPTMHQHRAYARNQATWAYEFRDRDAPLDLPMDLGQATNGARHSAELVYLMDMGERARLSDSQETLASSMRAYWANFAREGDPNGEGVEPWEAFNGGDLVQGLDDVPDGIGPVDFADEHRLEFWDDFGAEQATPSS